ncbi:MAG: hypothetical protein DSZ24_00180 [Thermodesulfatator sp.]|nr:MAG: hypothetical protein DSZ24_00180 [Thermodesulfatator sp.]
MGKEIKEHIQKVSDWFKSQIEPLPRRQKILLAIISLFLPLFLYIYFFLLPTYHKIDEIKRDIANLQKEIARYQKLASKRAFLKKKIAQRERFLKKVATILPTQKEIPGLLRSVSSQAKDSGLNVISFFPNSREVVRNYYNEIHFRVELMGEFSALVSFLERALHLPRIITIDSLDLKLREDKVHKKPLLYSVCQFATYRYTGKVLSSSKGRKR